MSVSVSVSVVNVRVRVSMKASQSTPVLSLQNSQKKLYEAILFSECTRENVFRISGRRTGESAATSHAPMQPYPYAVNSCFALIPKP